MSYSIAKQLEELKAAEWLEAHKSELSDVECAEQSHAEKHGYEVLGVVSADTDHEALLDSVLDEIAEIEADDAALWEVADESNDWITESGKFNVLPLAHWNKRIDLDGAKFPQRKVYLSERFDGAKYTKHQARATKAIRYFNIDKLVLDKAGRVRSSLPTTEAIKADRKAAIKAEYIKADRKAAPKMTAKMRLMRAKAGL